MINRLYSHEFFQARAIVYGVSLALVLLMLFADPFEYACNLPGNSCPGCGVKTGLFLILHGNITAALESNPISVLMAAAAVAALIDLLAGLTIQTKEKSS